MLYVKSEFVKHKILKYIVSKDSEKELNTNLFERPVHFNEISNALPTYPRKFLLSALHSLQVDKEILCNLKKEESDFFLLPAGEKSYYDRKFLKQSIKLQFNCYNDILKPIYRLIAITIAVITTLQNCKVINSHSNHIDSNSKQIETLEHRLKNIENVSLNFKNPN